jgi:hypothetical protein
MTTSDGGGAGLRPWLGLAAGAFMLLPLLAGPALARPLHDTTRFLVQQGKACVGAVGCRLIDSEPRRIKAGRDAEITAHCPDARPYLVNWDASFHEHISLRLAERGSGGVTVVATNQADATGRVTLVIGCAKNPPGPTLEIRTLGALPTGPLASGVR